MVLICSVLRTCKISAEPTSKDMHKSAIYDCDGDPDLAYGAFIPNPVERRTRRKAPRATVRCIATPAWATRIQGNTTFKSKILCCYDDPAIGARCVRSDCPFLHPTLIVSPAIVDNPYEVAPCAHAGKPGGCSSHSAILTDTTWKVPNLQYQEEKPEAEELEVDGSRSIFWPDRRTLETFV